MFTHVLAPFEGGKEQFPAYYRQFSNWAAASKDHSAMHYLLTWNPDGCLTDAKKEALLEFSVDREAQHLAKDCPKHVGSSGKAAKKEQTRFEKLYQIRMYGLLAVQLGKRLYLCEKIHQIQDEDCGEKLFQALLEWGGAKGVTNQMIMEKALNIVAKAKKARNIKGVDAAAVVELINNIRPDQRVGIDKKFSATVLTIMQTSEMSSLLVQSGKALPATMPRGQTAEWFTRIREIVERNA